MIDLDYLFDRILRPDELDPPGTGQDILTLAENAADWEKDLTDSFHRVDELLVDLEKRPVIYLDEVDRACLLEVLGAVRDRLDGDLQTQFTELAGECRSYLDNRAQLERYKRFAAA